MTMEEFKKSINLRSIEKCCATCKYGGIDFDGDCKCTNMKVIDLARKAKNAWYFGGCWYMGTKPNCVCDKWEKGFKGDPVIRWFN